MRAHKTWRYTIRFRARTSNTLVGLGRHVARTLVHSWGDMGCSHNAIHSKQASNIPVVPRTQIPGGNTPARSRDAFHQSQQGIAMNRCSAASKSHVSQHNLPLMDFGVRNRSPEEYGHETSTVSLSTEASKDSCESHHTAEYLLFWSAERFTNQW